MPTGIVLVKVEKRYKLTHVLCVLIGKIEV